MLGQQLLDPIPVWIQQAAARREAILTAALDEFSARGFAATRLDDVASRAGVAKGTIYLHFAEQLTGEVVLDQRRVGGGERTPGVYAIGEIITYSLVVTLPEGVAQNVSVLDALPSGLLPVSSQILTSGAPLLAAYNGVVPNIAPSTQNKNFGQDCQPCRQKENQRSSE